MLGHEVTSTSGARDLRLVVYSQQLDVVQSEADECVVRAQPGVAPAGPHVEAKLLIVPYRFVQVAHADNDVVKPRDHRPLKAGESVNPSDTATPRA